MADELADKIKNLKSDIEKYKKDIKGRGDRHRHGNTALVLLSIILSMAIMVSGIYDLGTLTAVLGAVFAALIAVQKAFPLGDMGFFYRTSVGDLSELEDSLSYLTKTEKDFERIVRQFSIIKKHVARNVPRGEALEAVQSMREEVKGVGVGAPTPGEVR